MPHSHRRFTQEFRDEAVRLAESSGRTRREVAEDLGRCKSSVVFVRFHVWPDKLRGMSLTS